VFIKGNMQLKEQSRSDSSQGILLVQWQEHFKRVAAKISCCDSLCYSIRHYFLHRKDAGCREFGLINSTIQNICKNRTKIISAFEQSG
jgi:hypothetical protein